MPKARGIEKGETQNECVSLSVAETQWGVKKAAHTHGGWLITDDVLVITHIIESYTKNPAEYGLSCI